MSIASKKIAGCSPIAGGKCGFIVSLEGEGLFICVPEHVDFAYAAAHFAFAFAAPLANMAVAQRHCDTAQTERVVRKECK